MRVVELLFGVLFAIGYTVGHAEASDDLCRKVLPDLDRSLNDAQAREDWDGILDVTNRLTQKLNDASGCSTLRSLYAAHAAEANCNAEDAIREYGDYLARNKGDASSQKGARDARDFVQRWTHTIVQVVAPTDAANLHLDVRITCGWSTGPNAGEKGACIATTSTLQLDVARPLGAACEYSVSADGVRKASGKLEPSEHQAVSIEQQPLPPIELAPPQPPPGPAPVDISTPPGSRSENGKHPADNQSNIFSSWIFWTISGVVVAGIVTTAIVLSTDSGDAAPVPVTTANTPPGASLSALTRH